MFRVLSPLLIVVLIVPAQADDSIQIGQSWQATDTLDVDSFASESSDDTRACLREFGWRPTLFSVTCEAPVRPGTSDYLIRFPSPHPSGNAANDLVALEWTLARDEAGQPLRAPAIVVIHESGSRMPIGKVFARGFAQRGLHALMIQLPYYGVRREGERPSLAAIFTMLRQAAADVRRARDAVAVLPYIEPGPVALQGTSLGGFVASLAAGLDAGYQPVFLTLSGGNLFEMIKNGAKEAAEIREELLQTNLTVEELKALAWRVEPNRLAHRLNPRRTWLYSGEYDSVVPIENARSLVQSAGLPQDHHILMPANHVSGILFLPAILDQMTAQVTGEPVSSDLRE